MLILGSIPVCSSLGDAVEANLTTFFPGQAGLGFSSYLDQQLHEVS